MSKGKLIVIEGVDGSGKSTQAKLVAERLSSDGRKIKLINYPTYTKSSALIEMYLSGQFGHSAQDVNAYAASTFFAVDRCADFLSNWKKDYDGGALVISSRYTTSNQIHQAAKLPRGEYDRFNAWIEDFEYGKVGIPRPDIVFFLDMPPEYAQKLISARYAQNGGNRDIHEQDSAYLRHCYDAALEVSQRLGWIRVSCVDNGEILPAEKICEKLVAAIKEMC